MISVTSSFIPESPLTSELPVVLGGGREAKNDPRIVSFGGGHGLYSALRAFRLLTENLTAVVTVADDGGSSGRLREEFGGLPPGDLRMALAALCDDGEWGRNWRDVIQDRFSSSGPLDGHAVGNLLITALWQRLGDHVEGLDWMARLLRAHGRVLPMSSVPLTIEADIASPGAAALRRVQGQCAVAEDPGRVETVRLLPENPPAREETIAAISAADVLNLGPGSWYTSVMPHVLVPELAEAIRTSTAMRTLTLNLDDGDSETEDLSLVDHLRSLRAHADWLRFDYVFVDDAVARREPELEGICASLFKARMWARPLASRHPGQHDSLKLAACYRDMLLDAGLLPEETW